MSTILYKKKSSICLYWQSDRDRKMFDLTWKVRVHKAPFCQTLTSEMFWNAENQTEPLQLFENAI